MNRTGLLSLLFHAYSSPFSLARTRARLFLVRQFSIFRQLPVRRHLFGKNLNTHTHTHTHKRRRERSFSSHIVKQPSTCNSRHFSCFQSWKNKEKFRVQGFKNKPSLRQTDQNTTSCYYVKQRTTKTKNILQ